MKINKRHLDSFEAIITKYEKDTSCPKKGFWKTLSNEDLWYWLVGQIIVVGSSTGNVRLQSDLSLKELVSFSALQTISCNSTKVKIVNSVLRKAGVRYASNKIDVCWKSIAICRNHNFINSYPRYFTGLMAYLASLKGESFELQRVEFLMKNFMFIKNKSSRDFLMSMGMNITTLALDVRVQNIFHKVGVDLPKSSELSRNSIYREVERTIIEKICHPLKVEPVKFDRILYQNYSELMRNFNS